MCAAGPGDGREASGRSVRGRTQPESSQGQEDRGSVLSCKPEEAVRQGKECDAAESVGETEDRRKTSSDRGEAGVS